MADIKQERNSLLDGAVSPSELFGTSLETARDVLKEERGEGGWWLSECTSCADVVLPLVLLKMTNE